MSVVLEEARFQVGDRVRVKFGIDQNRCGAIIHVGGDVGTYYGLLLDEHPRPMGYCEYELELESNANPETARSECNPCCDMGLHCPDDGDCRVFGVDSSAFRRAGDGNSGSGSAFAYSRSRRVRTGPQ